jgi:alkylation response protein AidB-like acyl-CoA dehydrogenase
MIREPETLALLQDGVRRFVREQFIPIAHAVADSNQTPAGIVQAMRALGLVGLTIPEQFGGLGLTMEAEVSDSGIERFYRDVRLFRIDEGTRQIQQLVIAKHMMRAIQRDHT